MQGLLKRFTVLLLAVLLSALVVQTEAAGASKAGSSRANFQKSLDRIMAQKGAPPGISVLINRNGRSQYFRRGVENIKTRKPMHRGRHFRIASVAKAFNGGIALSLVRQGKLHLSDTIQQILPGLLPKAKQVTLGQMLNHTAGLPDYIKDEKFVKVLMADPGRYMKPRKLVSFVRNTKLNHRPGTKYEYSDTDNVVVGLMAQRVTGLSYQKLLKREIGRRVQIAHTTLPNVLALPKPFISGYDPDENGILINQTFLINPALAWASGGIVSTLPDLGRYMRAYVGGRFFGSHARKAQRRWVKGSSSPPGPGVNTAGMALFKYRSKCGTVYGHTGSYPGYRIFAAASADGRRSIAYVVNAQITDTAGPKRVSALIRKSQVAGVCQMYGRKR